MNAYSMISQWLCEYEIAIAAHLWIVENQPEVFWDEKYPTWKACERAWAL